MFDFVLTFGGPICGLYSQIITLCIIAIRELHVLKTHCLSEIVSTVANSLFTVAAKVYKILPS